MISTVSVEYMGEIPAEKLERIRDVVDVIAIGDHGYDYTFIVDGGSGAIETLTDALLSGYSGEYRFYCTEYEEVDGGLYTNVEEC